MKLWIALLSFGLVVATTATAATETRPTKKVTKAKVAKAKASKQLVAKKKSGELQTDVKFDDSVLHGQYQTPDEALARVENEKALGDLLGVRKHFKDRLATASEQE